MTCTSQNCDLAHTPTSAGFSLPWSIGLTGFRVSVEALLAQVMAFTRMGDVSPTNRGEGVRGGMMDGTTNQKHGLSGWWHRCRLSVDNGLGHCIRFCGQQSLAAIPRLHLEE